MSARVEVRKWQTREDRIPELGVWAAWCVVMQVLSVTAPYHTLTNTAGYRCIISDHRASISLHHHRLVDQITGMSLHVLLLDSCSGRNKEQFTVPPQQQASSPIVRKTEVKFSMHFPGTALSCTWVENYQPNGRFPLGLNGKHSRVSYATFFKGGTISP